MSTGNERVRRVRAAGPANQWRARTLRACAAQCAIGLVVTSGAGAQTHTEDFTTIDFQDAAATTAEWDTVAGELRLAPFVREVVGGVTITGQALGVAVSGNHAYLADGPTGLVVIDISDPTAPVPADTVDTAGAATGVAIDGDRAYVADGTGGLVVVDIGDPTNAAIVGGVDTAGTATDVVLHGTHAFVADQTNGLVVIDISDAALPVQVGSVAIPGSAYDVAIAGDHAFVAASAGGVRIIDIGDPTSPVEVGSHATPATCQGIAVAGDLAFATVFNAGLQVLDIGDPTSPALLGSVDTPGSANGVVVSGDLAFVADWGDGVQVVDVSDPTSPSLVDGVQTGGVALDVVLDGHHVFVADWTGFTVLAVSAPALPSVVATLGGLTGPVGVTIANDYAFLAVETVFPGLGSLMVVDISDPTTPSLVTSIVGGADATQLAIAGDRGFLANQAGLQVLDIANPANPVAVGSLALGFAYERSVAVAGDYALMGGGSRLHVIDISDPTNPVVADSLVGFPDVKGLAISGTHALLTVNLSGVRVIEITDPTNISVVGSVDTENAQGIAVSGDHAFVADGSGGVVVLDIVDPANPSIVANLPTMSAARNVLVSGDEAYVSETGPGADGALLVIDISDPENPVSIGRCATTSLSYGLALSGDHVFAANGGSLDVIEVRQHAFDSFNDVGQSLPIDDAGDTLLRARLSSVETNGVTWALSADGGGSFETIEPGGDWTRLSVTGTDLLWRSQHAYSGAYAGVGPTVSSLTVEWLSEPGAILSITDVPDDQGGWVRLGLRRSGYDFADEDSLSVTGYGVYRRVDGALRARVLRKGTKASASLRSAAPWSSFDGATLLELDGRVYVRGGDAIGSFPPGTWEHLTFMAAAQVDDYLLAVPTLADSTASGAAWSVHFVSTHTTTPSIWFASAPDSGYSVDDIAPAIPANLAFGQPDVLTWDAAEEPDFAYHTIYGSPNVLLDGAVVIGYSTTSTFDVSAEPHDYYLVTTSDAAGNESPHASLMDPTTVSVGGPGGVPVAFAVRGASPNPLRSTTRIGFDLPRAAEVRLHVHDAIGRLVTELSRRSWPAGRHSVTWDARDAGGRRVAPGVYFVRVEAGPFTASRRLVVLR